MGKQMQLQSQDTIEDMGVMAAMVVMDIMERGKLMLNPDITEAMEAMVDMVVAMDIMERDLQSQDTMVVMDMVEAMAVMVAMEDIMVKFHSYFFPISQQI